MMNAGANGDAPRDPEGAASQEVADQLPESEHGISEQEKDEIRAQLDSVLSGREAATDEAGFHYEPRHRRDILPPLIGIGSILVGVIAAIILFSAFQRQEQSLLADASAADTAEAQLLEEFRSEAEERLAAQESEIEQIRDELSSLEQERDSAIQEAEAEFLEREAELEARLERELAAERERLEEQGYAGDELEEQLAAAREELETDHEEELEELRSEYEREVAEREAQLDELEAEYAEGMEQLSDFREQQDMTAAELNELAEQRSRERQFADRITERYAEAVEHLEADAYDDFDRVIAELQELLDSEQTSELPAIGDRVETDRELVSALTRLAELEQEAPTDQDGASEDQVAELEDQIEEANAERERAVSELEDEIAERERTIARLENEIAEREQQLSEADRTIAELEQELSSSRQQLSAVESERNRYRQAADSAETELEDFRQQYRTVRDQIIAEAEESSNAESDMDEIVASVDVRLEIIQALRSEPVRQENPGLDEDFEEYLDTFARANEREGAASALNRAADLIDEIDE